VAGVVTRLRTGW